MRFEPRRILILFFALLAALPAQATVYQWVGSAGNGNMTGTNANYSPSGAPITGDTISWNATTYTAAPTANGNLTVGELWFGGNNTGNVTFGAGTSVLTLNADGATPGVGIQMDSGSGAVSTSGTKFALGGNQTWLNNSASLLTANGTITNSGNVTGYTLTVDGSGNTTLNGIISNGGTVGTTALTKNGSGTLTLAGNNTYTGPTTIKSGTLKVSTSTASANAFGGNGTIIIGDAANTGAAATLEFNTTLTPGFPTFSNAINIVGNGTSTISALNYSPTFAGNVTLSNNLNILSNNASGSFLIFNGGITGNGNVTVTVQSGSAVGSYVTFNGLVNNNGALTFNNISYSGSKANTIAGGVGPNVTAITQASSNSPLTISGNAIQVNSGGTTLTASGAALFTVSGGITGTGNLTLNTNNNTNGILVTTTAINNVGAVTNSGTGTAATTISSTIGGNVTSVIQNSATSMLILNAANTAWSGGIQINSGTLENLQNATNPLGTGALTLGSAGSDAMLLWATGGGTMTNAITVAAGAGNRTIRTNAASGSLNLNSTINLNGHDLVFDTLNQTGFIIGGTITGSNKISFTNSGNLTGAATSLNLSENSFTGIFEITSGATLKMILNNGATAGTVNVLSGGNFTTTQGVTVTIAGLTGDAGSFTNAAGAKVLTIAGSGTYDFKGLIQDSAGAGGLTMNGTGTQILSGNNTYTGATTVTAGTLRAGVAGTAFGLNSAVSLANTASATLDLNNFSTSIGSLAGGGTTGGNVTLGSGTLTTGGANASTTYNGTISGTGGLIKVGTGNQTLTGSNTYTGGTGVNGGALILDFSTATTNILNSSSALTLGGGTFKLIGKASNTNSQTVNGTTLNAGASALTLAANATANPLLLNLGAITRNVGGTVDFTQPTGTISGTNGFVTSTGNTSGILGGWATVAGTDWATNNGTNIVALPSGNYTANTWAAANNTNVTTSSAPGSDSTTNSLRFNTAGAYTLTLTGTNTITSGGILVTSTVGNNLSTITGGNLQGASGADLVVIQNNITNGLAISSVIQNNTSATGLTKSGSGILTLTNANTYTGLTTIGSGTLQIGSGADAGSIDSTSAIINNGSLVYNVAAGNRTVAVGISGTGSLTQNSTGGTLTLAAANTYTGATTLTTGNLILTGGLSGSSITIGTGSSAANFTQSSTGVIAGTGTTFTLTNGTATLAGTNTYTGTTTVSAGTLSLAHSGGTIADTGNVTISGGTLDVAQSDTVNTVNLSSGTISGVGTLTAGAYNISGTSLISANLAGAGTALTKTVDATTVTLSGTNTYTGKTQVSAGTLAFGANQAVSIDSAFYISATAPGTASTLDLAGFNTTTNSTVIIAGTGSAANGINNLTTGNGTLTLGSGSGVTYGITNPGTSTISGKLDLGVGTHTFSVADSTNTTNELNVTATISSTAGAYGITKTGTGNMTLSGINTYTGSTTITGGKVILGNALALQNSAYNTTGANATVGLDVTGYTNPTLGGLAGSVNLATAITGYGSVSGLTLNPQIGISNTYSGNITDGAAGMTLTKTGAGTQTLSGTNTYTGTTTISQGALSIATTGALPGWSTTGNYSVASGATLAVYNAVSDANITTMLGTGNFAAGAALGFDTTTASRTYSVVLANTANGTLGLTKLGTNTLTLNGTNTYTGGTLITSGTLVLSGTGSINSTSGVSVATGATFTNSSSVGYNKSLTLAEGATLSGTGTFAPAGMTLTANLADGFTTIALGNLLTRANNLELTLTGITVGTYTLFSGTVNGTFATMSIGGSSLTGAGGNFSGTVGGNAYSFTNADNQLVVTIPEPSTCALLAAGLIVLAALRRRHSSGCRRAANA